MKLIFDTSTIIDGLRTNRSVRDMIKDFDDSDYELYVSAIVGFELFSGQSIDSKRRLKQMIDFLKYFQVIDLTWQISKRAGDIFRSGIRGLQVPDYIIAATALELNVPIVTLNWRHFAKISGVRIFEF